MTSARLYQPLNEKEREIRLVTLLPGPPGGLIECEINTVPLFSKNTIYEALSYEWGDPSAETVLIQLEGRQVPIQHNLWLFLCVLRSKDKKRTLWIDAICINQNDIDERSQQVFFMRHIYMRASFVRAWLGPVYEGSHRVFGLASLLDEGMTYSLPETKLAIQNEGSRPFFKSHSQDTALSDLAIYTQHLDQDVATIQFHDLHPRLQEWMRVMAFLEYGTSSSKVEDLLRADVLSFAARSYWTRIWIVQEILLPKNLKFYCGQDSSDWNALVRVLYFLRRYQGDFSSTLDPEKLPIFQAVLDRMPGTRLLEKYHNHTGSSVGYSFEELLETCKDSRCAVPHDRVYALLGLAMDVPAGVIPIDYSLPIESVRECVRRWSDSRPGPTDYGSNSSHPAQVGYLDKSKRIERSRRMDTLLEASFEEK